MSSVQHLREFISERLTAAAEEIFTEFEKTIVQYEEEMDRQRRLLDITWKPPGNFHTADIPHQYVNEEEAFLDEQLYNQECNSNLDQEEPESLHIKDEKEELPTSQEGEQLLLKHENGSVSTTPTHAKNDLREPEPNRDHIPCDNSPVNESLEGNKLDDLGPKNYAELTAKTTYEKSGNDSVENFLLETHSNTDHTAEKLYFCFTCGKRFSNLSSLERHSTLHTNEKPYSCKTCGKRFSRRDHFNVHIRSHTGEKPYTCKTCGKCFSLNSTMLRHMRSHTSEKPFSCKTCGKCFSKCSSLFCHMKTHTGNRLYSCKTCGRSFNGSSHLARHMRTHTGEKPYSCETCGKRFSQNSNVMRHMRTHR